MDLPSAEVSTSFPFLVEAVTPAGRLPAAFSFAVSASTLAASAAAKVQVFSSLVPSFAIVTTVRALPASPAREMSDVPPSMEAFQFGVSTFRSPPAVVPVFLN